MFKNLHFKIILILVIFTIILMSVIGVALIVSAYNFYSGDFLSEMDSAFSKDSNMVLELNGAVDDEDYAQRQYEILRAYSGAIGADKYRSYYVLDSKGNYLYGSELDTTIEKTDNIINAIAGLDGNERKTLSGYIDYALMIKGNKNISIIYIKDTQGDVQSIVSMILEITIQAMLIGMVVAIALSFILARAITNPISKLTSGAKKIADGDFDEEINVLANDEIGTLSETFNFMKDVLKSTLDEVSGEREKFESLFLYLNDSVVTFDSNGNLLHINKMAKELLHFDNEENLEKLEHFDYSSMLKTFNIDETQVNLTSGETKTVDINDVIFEGKAFDMTFADFKYGENSQDKEARGIMCVIHDISERYQLDKSRREFVAEVSHELRTPLTSIKGAIETIKEYPDLDQNIKDEFMQMAIDECDRMTRMQNDLLTLSRLDNKRTQWKISTFKVSEFIDRIGEIMSVETKAREHNLIINVENNIPELTADKEKLQQVLINIISNSVKYTNNGGTIEVSAKDDNGSVLINVKDNGMGIPSEDIPRLFERFYRVEKARTSDTGGTGLGLAIAKEIIDAHGGQIWVESEVGVGTSTWVRLPYKTIIEENEN